MTENSLEEGERHPAAYSAIEWIAAYVARNPSIIESVASCALAGNRSAEICHSTLTRMLKKEAVSDRYVLGLAWFLRSVEEREVCVLKERVEKALKEWNEIKAEYALPNSAIGISDLWTISYNLAELVKEQQDK